jgi:hypothetical protein
MNTPQINDGGPAFPRTKSTGNLSNSTTEIISIGGMSLRDWFAGQALAHPYTHDSRATNIAELAYLIADAMIAAQEVKP